MNRFSSQNLQDIKSRVSEETGLSFEQESRHLIPFKTLLVAILIILISGAAVFAANQFRINKRILEAPEGTAPSASESAADSGISANNDAEEQNSGSTVSDYGYGTVNGFPISYPFGYNENPYTVSKCAHSGVDIAAPKGTPVLAAAAGTVRSSEWSTGYGNMVIIDHEDGFSTCYGHMMEIMVEAGQVVEAGEQIGTVGATGMATGPHLHFELRINDEPVDPSGYWE
jgi:murein DD-endopeptidase MepM/ murein hydrolase activator NlpD